MPALHSRDKEWRIETRAERRDIKEDQFMSDARAPVTTKLMSGMTMN